MCGIVDTNAAHEVFGPNRPEAGVKFLDWIEAGSGRLFVGGQLLQELNQTPFRRWARNALNFGKIRSVRESDVNAKTQELRNEGSYTSDDPHVLALAVVSGARLLYTNDIALQQDFKNKSLIDNPRGKVYSTRDDASFQRSHSKLLQRKDLCRP